MQMKYVRRFEEIGMGDVSVVGGKNASLGEMICALSQKGINVPSGFAITAQAYGQLLEAGGITEKLTKLLASVDKENVDELSRVGRQARALIHEAGIPFEVAQEIRKAYKEMSRLYGQEPDVAVRSSATAEDLPEASFAGQQESFLNVRGERALLDACLHCFASLFTDRAIAYRIDKGFDHMSVQLSIGVQKMVRSDCGAAGVIFTVDTESGFPEVVLITAAYGLGENVVAGRVDPDEFVVFKPTLRQGFNSIVRRKLGAKQLKLVYATHGSKTTENKYVTPGERELFAISDTEAIELAKWACTIEEHYSRKLGKHTPMDIEWARDGLDGKLYIVQARPETVQALKDRNVVETYRLTAQAKPVLTGRAIGQRIGAGPARVVHSSRELSIFREGEVLIADMTDPDWEPIMKRASAIVTNRGGRTCHAAIVSREMGVPCVVGTERATELLQTGMMVTVSCAEGDRGKVYDGKLGFSSAIVKLDELPETRTKIMLNVGNPEQAFSLASLPVDGVGLAREEFIIAHEVKVHPLALTRFDEIEDASVKEKINALTRTYPNREQYFIDRLAEGVGAIGAAFYPRDVIVRLSDFKTNEYANLIGGAQFEPKEDNPMIGFRGACRYYDERYKDGFALECKALRKAREEMGLTNIKVMIPFCRTVEEGRRVLKEMSTHGLVRGENKLEVYVMCELPSNVMAAEQFATIFDGFSIGSNDLTQLTLGLDRDSEVVAHLFDERDIAVKRMISHAILEAKRAGRKIGICGQAPSDYPEFAKFLVEQDIDSMSLSEDALLRTILIVAEAERAIDANSKTRLAGDTWTLPAVR